MKKKYDIQNKKYIEVSTNKNHSRTCFTKRFSKFVVYRDNKIPKWAVQKIMNEG